MGSDPTLLIFKDFMIANTPVPTIAAPPPKLLDQVRAKVRLKHYSIRTKTQYVHWVKRFIAFHGKRHPKDMDDAEVDASLSHLQRGGVHPESGLVRIVVSISRSVGR